MVYALDYIARWANDRYDGQAGQNQSSSTVAATSGASGEGNGQRKLKALRVVAPYREHVKVRATRWQPEQFSISAAWNEARARLTNPVPRQ